MKTKRLKILFIWGLLLAIVTNGGAFLIGGLLGDGITGLLLVTLLVVGFATYAGYSAASSLRNSPDHKNKTEITMIGVSVAFIAALLSIGIKYFTTGRLDFGIGFLPVIFGGLGSYLVARKKK